jgi:hypothetical protein
MLRFIKEARNPELLVVTPLLINSTNKHKLSRDTKVGLLRNDINFAWITYESNGSTSKNYALGIKAYRDKYFTPKYTILIDKDVVPARHMLDDMYGLLKKTDNKTAFCYCNFEFKGTVNKKFYHIPYDPLTLIQGNYISSNSMIKLDKLDEIDGVVTDKKYDRLSDWALWLSFLSYGYYGVLCDNTSFVDISNKTSVSSGSQEEYKHTHELVIRDFIDPLTDGIII